MVVISLVAVVSVCAQSPLNNRLRLDTHDVIPIRIAPDAMPTIDLEIRGRKTRFGIDTGCSSSVLASHVADTLGIKPVGAAVVNGLSGSTRSAVAPLDFRIGARPFSLRAVVVHSLKTFDPPHHSGDVPYFGGLLGSDFFRQYGCVIDYHSRVIYIENLGRYSKTLLKTNWLSAKGSPKLLVSDKAFTLSSGEACAAYDYGEPVVIRKEPFLAVGLIRCARLGQSQSGIYSLQTDSIDISLSSPEPKQAFTTLRFIRDQQP